MQADLPAPPAPASAKPDLDAKVGTAPQDSAAGATPAAGPPEAVPPAAVPPAARVEKKVWQLKQGETLVAEVSEPLVLALIANLKATPPTFRLSADNESNKKIPPGTLFLKFREGNIVAAGSDKGCRYGFAKTKDTLVMKAGVSEPPKTLEEMIRSTGAKAIAKHQAFEGVPKSVVCMQQNLRFVPTDPVAASLWHAADALRDCKVGWTLKVTTQLQMIPTGVFLHTHKQLILPAGGHLQLK